MNMTIRTTLAAVALAALAGCSNIGGEQATGTMSTKAPYDRLFSAAMFAIPPIGFHATSVNRAEGMITAEQGVIGRGGSTAMTANVTKEGQNRVLRVTFMSPPGSFALGDFNKNVYDYFDAVNANLGTQVAR